METFDAAFKGGQPVLVEIHLLEPFIAATRAALNEMAGTEVGVRGMVRTALHHALGDIVAVIGLSRKRSGEDQGLQFGEEPPNSSCLRTTDPWPLTSASAEALILGFPQRTAAALASRILTGVTTEVDQNLIRDCMGEIANVVTGQAKALLAETAYRFVFALPPVVDDVKKFRHSPGLDCLMVVFTCDQGEFALQLCLELSV